MHALSGRVSYANVYTLVTVSNDKQNIQHRSTTSSLVQVMHVHLLFQIHIIKMSSNFQVQDEIQEKNPASTYKLT